MSMPSHSSSSHPESLHPYHRGRSQSTTSLGQESGKKRKSILSHLLLSSWKEGLLPLPESAHLSSPSPPPSNHSPYVSRPPSPSTYTRLAARDGGFDVGCDTRPVIPSTTYDPWAYRDNAPPPPAGIAPDEFWDNVDLPLSTYFPSNYIVPSHRTPSPTRARNLTTWDQPIQNPEWTPKPV
ncbi:hypothetical protein ARMGADRAFT_1083688 [Armillaria gallica]|uniref:Uncharacterized protein n=1 Tax=Armillaria gallica TaxID=47427 RepID=A0A2H3DE61_ARMGA|nr:hypothetical protein ARMGADRAFT_1083688 [Armillaria gallica]